MKKWVLLGLLQILSIGAVADQFWVSPDGRLVPVLPRALRTASGVVYPAPQTAFESAGWRLETTEEAAAREAAEEAARRAMPKTISKLDLLLVLRELNKLDAFFAWLEGSGLKPFWDAAQELSTDHPLYEQALASVQEALGLTDAERDAILEQIAKPAF